jgi:CHAT domain-containing protein/Flp pilus assembly protein TadD
LGALLLAIGGCRHAVDDRSISQRSINVLLADRFTAGRLAQQTAWARCVLADTDSVVPHTRCGEPPKQDTKRWDRIGGLASELGRIGRRDSTPLYLRAAALVELSAGAASPSRVAHAVTSLERARRLAPNDPEILNDLAVAYLELGQADQRLETMLRALDAIEQAVEHDSTAAAGLFNRALILERLYMIASAKQGWSRYLAVERNEEWRAEAQEHLQRLAQGMAARAWSQIQSLASTDGDTPPAEFVELVARAPQDARDSAFAILREWGVSLRSGDTAHAKASLAMAREIARALELRRLDGSVSLAVRAIDEAAGDPARATSLARAHVDLADGIAANWKGSFDSAVAGLTRAEVALRRVGSPAARWAAFYRGTAEMEQGKFDSADRRFERVLTETTPQEFALHAKAVWGEGVTQLRRGHFENAIRLYRAARDSIARAREPENAAAIFYLLTEALDLAGQSAPGRDEAYPGLRGLAPFRNSNFLNNHLTNVASLARRDGLGYAALAIMHEVLDVAPHLGRPQVVAWAYRAYARELMLLGRFAAAHAALDSARPWVDRIPRGPLRDRVHGDVQFVSAQLTGREDPRRARDTLAAVVAAFTKQKLSTHLPQAFYELSLAENAAGDHAGARRTLDRAISAFERQSGSFRSTDARATFSETVENLFDSMMDLQLAAQHPDSAFAYLERGRQAAWSGRPKSVSTSTPLTGRVSLERIRSVVPADMLVVEYAVLRDQLVTWTTSKERSSSAVTRIARTTIATLVDQAVDEMDNPTADSASARARLFDLLLRKLDLHGISRIAIIPDRELSRLPFAALWDTTKRAYLVENFELRTAPSAAFLMATLGRHSRAPGAGQALVVGNPMLDTMSARLPSLPGALEEAQGVAKQYPSHRLLTAERARRDSVLALLATSSVFHFAGHAIINSEQPELSYLALASTGTGGADNGILRAREIGNLHPSNLQLVVLSACSTLNPRPSHTGAIAGLAYSFLQAGVPATISTLWDVSDKAVAELLIDFHHQLVTGIPAAEALRSAQRASITRSVPRAWAAFIYTGP